MYSPAYFNSDPTGSVPVNERVLRLVVHIKGKKIKVLVSSNATIQDCRKEIQRVYKSITGMETSVSHLCDSDQCILCDDYPAGLILSDKMEVFGVTEEDASESNTSQQSSDVLGSVSNSLPPSNHGTPQHKPFPVSSFSTPVNPMYFHGGFPVPGTYFMSCPDRSRLNLQDSQDMNTPMRSVVMDSSLGTQNVTATPLRSPSTTFKDVNGTVTPLVFSKKVGSSSAHTDTDGIGKDSNWTQPTLSTPEEHSEVTTPPILKFDSIASSSPEVSPQHHVVKPNKQLHPIPDIAIRSNSKRANSHKAAADRDHSLPSGLSNAEENIVEDTLSTDEDSDSTVIEESLKHHKTTNAEFKSKQSVVTNGGGLPKKSKGKRKADIELEQSPKKLKISNQNKDYSPRMTRVRTQNLTQSYEGTTLKGQLKGQQQKRHGHGIQNQSKSRHVGSEGNTVKTTEKLHTSDHPMSTSQQRRATLQTKKTAEKKAVNKETELKHQSDILEREKVTKERIHGKISQDKVRSKKLSKDGLQESQLLFDSGEDNSSSSEDCSVYMSPRQSVSVLKDNELEDQSDSLSEEGFITKNSRVGKAESASAANKTTQESTQQDSSSTSSESSDIEDEDLEDDERIKRTIPSLGSLVNKSTVGEVKSKPQVRKRHLPTVGSKTFSSSRNVKNK